MERADVGRAVAEKGNGDPRLAPQLERERGARDLREPAADDGVRPEEADREAQELVEASVEFAKNGTDPKPEDALKNLYA